MMADTFEEHREGLISPLSHAAPVTPDDSVGLIATTRAIYVGGGGDVAITTRGGETVTFTNAPEGLMLPVRATHVLATGTTATDLLALW